MADPVAAGKGMLSTAWKAVKGAGMVVGLCSIAGPLFAGGAAGFSAILSTASLNLTHTATGIANATSASAGWLAHHIPGAST